MTLKVVPADLTAGPGVFTFTVPGNERWTVQSICAQVTRGVGGVPNRGYALAVTSGQTALGLVGAPDLGTEPGQGVVTWADAPAAAVTFSNDMFVVAPFASIPLDGGYVLIGQILHSVAGDAFVIVNALVDFVIP